MENNKSESNLLKYIGYFLGGIMLLFILVFLVNKLIIAKAPFEVAQDNDWIGFWGGIVGGIISGFVTFIALKITIHNEDRKRREDRMINILPYLTYSTYMNHGTDDEKQIYQETYTIKTSNEDKSYNTIKFSLVIDNLGLGTAIEPQIKEMIYDGVSYKRDSDFLNKIGIDVGGKAGIEFKTIKVKEKEKYMTLKIGYFNLLKDYYEQDIEIKFPLEIKKDNKIVYPCPKVAKVHKSKLKNT